MVTTKRTARKKVVSKSTKPVSPTGETLKEKIPKDQLMNYTVQKIDEEFCRIHKDSAEFVDDLSLEKKIEILDRGFGMKEDEIYFTNAQIEQAELPDGEFGVERVTSLVNKEYFSTENAEEVLKILVDIVKVDGREVLRGTFSIKQWMRIGNTLGLKLPSGKDEDYYMEKVLVFE